MGTPERAASRLLDGLGETALEAIGGDLDRVRLEPGRTLVPAHETIRRVYFPESGLIALSLMLPDGRTAGVTLIGNEGIAGLSAAAGVAEVTDAVVQVPGTARVMSASAFRAALRTNAAFRAAVEAYTVAMYAHLAQTVACNRLHGLDQRAARWLLLAHDRTQGDSFPLTQEAFADLLGVSRPAVSTVGARFARGGSVEFRRGTVHILDASSLERASCECLEADRDAFGAVTPLTSRAALVPRPVVERAGSLRSLAIIRPEIRRAR